MKILVIGGTRFFGIHMVHELLDKGHEVTIATRGITPDDFGDKVKRIVFQRTDEQSVKEVLSGEHYDVVIDKIAYCSNDIKYVMDAVDCDKYIYMSSMSVYDPKHVNTVIAKWVSYDLTKLGSFWHFLSLGIFAEQSTEVRKARFQSARLLTMLRKRRERKP